jgi:integrase
MAKGDTYKIAKATKVTLRGRISSDKTMVSLYLDWMDSGKRMYEFLPDKIYLKPKIKEQKEHNEIVLRSAKERMGLQDLDLLKDRSMIKNHKSTILFKDFYMYAMKEKKPNGDKKKDGTVINYDKALNKIIAFAGDRIDKIRLKDIDKKFLRDFREFLLDEGLSRSSASTYFQKFGAIMRTAVKQEYLDKDPFVGIDPIRKETPRVNYLLFEDLQKLKDAYCEDPILKKAALFASQTGLRAVDIKPLTWRRIVKVDDKYSIVVKQEKTDVSYIVYFRQNVMDMIGPPGNPDDLLFPGFKNDNHANARLTIWLLRAKVEPRGIPDQRFTLHDFRHTFAIQLGINGANIYEISQMLGHSDIETTVKYYARVLEHIKRDIISKMPEL